MNFYELINNQFKELNLSIDFEKCDVLEYMILEKMKCLNALQDMPIRCRFEQGAVNGIVFKDKEPRSTISILNEDTDDKTKRHFDNAISKIIHLPKGIRNGLISSPNTYTFVILDSEIEQAVASSSLYIAAGDLTKLSLPNLLELQHKISLYKISDQTINTLASSLRNKISIYISKKFDEKEIERFKNNISLKFDAELKLTQQEQNFDDLFFELTHLIQDLKKKGNRLIKDFTRWDLKGNYVLIENPDFLPAYQTLVTVASKLSHDLNLAKNMFFNNPPTKNSLAEFKQNISKAIVEASSEFANHRGEWHQLHAVLKAILGILAAITIIPAIIVDFKLPHGFIGTFFKTPETDSLKKLKLFEEKLNGKSGVFDHIEESINSLSINTLGN